MKKSEFSASSEAEDDEPVFSFDDSMLSSHSEAEFPYGLSLMDGEYGSGDVQNTVDMLFTHLPLETSKAKQQIVEENDCYGNIPPVPKDLELRDYTIWARVELTKGRRFGPIPAQLKDSPPPTPTVWKVVDERGNVKAWVDIMVARGGQWTAFLRVPERKVSKNVCPAFIGGQIYLEVIEDVEAGQELKLSTYDLLLPYESSQRNGNVQSCSSADQDSDPFVSTTSGSSQNSLKPMPSQNQPPPPPLPPPPPPLLHISNSESESSPVKDNLARCLTASNLDFQDYCRLNDSAASSSHLSEDSGQGEREYKCPQCPKVFNWKSNLIRHQVAHDESRRYVCENCKKVFTDPSNLQRHIRSQHIGARSHACPECGKTFATSSGLKQHTHIHSSVKPFRCEVCFKAYTQFSNLCRHKRMHATCRMQIKCHKCGQAFSAVTSLSKHKRFCEGTPNNNPSSTTASSSSQQQQQQQPSNQTNAFEPSKAVPMSLAAPNNSLLFYPRPGFPIYPPSLFAYPLFSGAGIPAPPPLIPDAGALPGVQNGNSFACATQAAQEFQRHLLGNVSPQKAPDTKQEVNSQSKNHKRNSEASESDGSEDLSSDTGGEDVSSISEGDSEPDVVRSPVSTPQSQPQASSPSKNETPTMFPNHRQDSPKQGSVCPDPSMIMSPVTSNGHLRTIINNGIVKSDHEMPFDLSQNSKSRQNFEESSDFHSKSRDDSKSDDQPLDLRVTHRKSFHPVVTEERPKTPMFNEKEQSREYGTPKNSVLPALPQPLPPVEISKPESPIPQSPNKLHMAYPRPIHPMFLESMYRLQQEKPPFGLFPGADRIMPAFPPRYPFLGPLLGPNPSFDFMRAQMEKVGKPIHEMMSPHLGKAKERYSCKFCGKIFPRSANLTRHLRTHTGEQPYKCKYCERSFSISSNLQRHVRNIHNKEKPFKCPLCDRCFGQQTNLDRHLKKHEADGPTILDDSPKTIEVDDKDETYFDEIRSFIGKVTNSNHINSAPLPMGLSGSGDDRKRERDLVLLSSLSSRQQSPGSGHSENIDDETDDVSPSDQDEEPSLKKHRSSERLPTSSPSGESNRSPDSTKDLDRNAETPMVGPHLRNGDMKLSNQQKALGYDMMMSLNRNLDIGNGGKELNMKSQQIHDEMDDDEHKDSSDDEIVDPVDDDETDAQSKNDIDVD